MWLQNCAPFQTTTKTPTRIRIRNSPTRQVTPLTLRETMTWWMSWQPATISTTIKTTRKCQWIRPVLFSAVQLSLMRTSLGFWLLKHLHHLLWWVIYYFHTTNHLWAVVRKKVSNLDANVDRLNSNFTATSFSTDVKVKKTKIDRLRPWIEKGT